MAWFGDGLSSLSNLKGQITSFTKEVLSEGIVEETDQRTRELTEANERCVQLQEILNSKDAEISLLRRQNCELQKAVVELNARPRESNDANSLDDDGGGGFFWDPPPVKNRESTKNPERISVLQERLSQATVKIRELEDELRIFRSSANERNEDVNDGHRKAEFLRAKQDMLNRIIQIGEKGRDAERNLKRLPLDEAALINDFRTAISKLDSHEQCHMIKNALRALDAQRQETKNDRDAEKFDLDEKREKFDRPRLESISLLASAEDTEIFNGIADNGDSEANNRDEIDALRRRIDELQREKEFLTSSLDELDKEHAQSLEAILAMKDQLQKKHEALQNAYEQLYVECNEAQTRLQSSEMEKRVVTDVEANNNRVSAKSSTKETFEISNEDKQIQTEEESSETDSPVERAENNERKLPGKMASEEKICQTDDETAAQKSRDENHISSNDGATIEDLTRSVNEILKNCHLETVADENIFECLAKRYVEANWKKELLERKLNDASREFKETCDLRDSLQMECYDMQTNMETLLLQIEHLKSNLPSIPEASEERVASLETETESMSEEIKCLRAENKSLELKNYELVTSMSILEGSLRNQENLEAEVRNTKQQLIIAKQQLDGASRNVENNENIMEDLSRRVHSSLEENNELRKKIDVLESELRRSNDERTKISEERENIVGEFEKEMERLIRESNESRTRIKSLENDVKSANEAKNEMEKDFDEIAIEKEHLETERLVLRENSTEKETSDLLENLRGRLNLAEREKNDLEYDLMNMRKELDAAIDERKTMEKQIDRLNFDNVRLISENNELMEQLSSCEKESSERIELLQTEMNLLAQEYSTLKRNDDSLYEKKMAENEAKHACLTNELTETRRNLDDLRSLNEELKNRIARLDVLEEKSRELDSLRERFLRAEEKCRNLEIQLSNSQEELTSLREKSAILEQCQNEGKTLQSRYDEMEKICSDLKNRQSRTESENNDLRGIIEERASAIAELTEKMKKLEILREKSNENASMAKETIDGLSQLVREKDEEIERLESTITDESRRKRDEEENIATSLKAEREDLVKLVQEKHENGVRYYAEIQRLAELVNEQTASMKKICGERDEKVATLMEKESELLWSRNELSVVRQRLKSLEETQNNGEICNIVEHSKQIAQAAIINEKCNALEAALINEQTNNRIMQNQLIESQSREANAAKELQRLRTHLVEIEASYTEEALIAEESRKLLEAKLAQAEEKAQNSSTVYTSASIRANQQVETLQQQMALIVQQRDDIQGKLSAAEDKVLSHTASLANLQIVLEQFQRDKENDIQYATEKLRQQLKASYKEQEELRNEIFNLKTQLSEAKECLQAASRLTEQLDKKTKRIEELNQEVAELTELVNTADERIKEATSNGQGKVDKNLVKNLLLGFLTASTMDKSSVLRVFATVLEFDEAEREKIGLNNPTGNNGWFSGLLGNGGSASAKDQEASLSAAFVRFLESESKPKPQLPALTISNSSLSRPGHSRQHSTSSNHSGLLLSSVTLPSFPDFVPSRNTGSILKEVLKDS